MTKKEMEREYGKVDWYKTPGEVISWGRVEGIVGINLFSFDGGKIGYSVFGVGKNELTPEQIEILEKENPVMAHFYMGTKRYTPQDVMDEATSMGYADATYYGEQDGITYYKLVPKEGETPIDTLFLSQDKDGKIETVNSLIVFRIFPNRE